MTAPAAPWREVLTSLVLVVFGAVVVLEAWRMPRFEHLAVNPYTVPGIVPGLLGAVIAVLGLVMLLRAFLRVGAVGATPEGATAPVPRGASAIRLALTLVLTLGYAGGLVGRVPFALATFLFVLAFVALFGWPKAAGSRARVTLLLTAALQAAAVAIVVTLVFERLFLVRLP